MAHARQRPSERCKCCITQEDVWKQRVTIKTQQKKTRLVCKKWQTKQKTKQQKKTRSAGQRCQTDRLRCSKCEVAYEDACWTRIQRQNHRARQTKLVCKACRAQGFHPRALEAYTCQTCKSNLGTTRFKKVLLKNSLALPCLA